MPYECEDCKQMGARMNSLFEIRLCNDCSDSFKYKLICKSKALDDYLLTKSDLDNNINPPKEYLVKNPHYKSGPPMTLYLESEIQQIFLSKYDNLINNVLDIPNRQNLNLNDNSDIKNIVQMISDFNEEKKHLKKQEKYDKILNKYNIEDETHLPDWVQDKLLDSKSVSEYERIIANYFRFTKLLKLLKEEKLSKYIDHKVCHDYIYQNAKTIKLEQIPIIIRFMLRKKNLIKNQVLKHNIPTSKYSSVISEYINSYDSDSNSYDEKYSIKTISNDLDMLVEYIVGTETRTNELANGLKSRGLALRADSVLCSNYIKNKSEYELEQIIDIMEQMEWFFTNTKYSIYMKEYDRYNGYDRYDGYDRDRYNYKWGYDSDDLEQQKQDYNKNKSETVKKKCLKEWILNGKKGIYPISLNPQIEMIEKELENEKNRPIQQKPLTIEQIRSPLTHKCANIKCSNTSRKSCKNNMCGLCCDKINCHKH
jgi:hypothetical protein